MIKVKSSKSKKKAFGHRMKSSPLCSPWRDSDRRSWCLLWQPRSTLFSPQGYTASCPRNVLGLLLLESAIYTETLSTLSSMHKKFCVVTFPHTYKYALGGIFLSKVDFWFALQPTETDRENVLKFVHLDVSLPKRFHVLNWKWGALQSFHW